MLGRSLVFLALGLGSTAIAGSPRVFGGQQVPQGQWPDAAAVCYGSCSRFGVECTGVLIAPTVVLTAGHCITETNRPPSAVLLNTNDFREGGEEIPVASYEASPDYTGFRGHDLAVLVLDHPATTPPRALAWGCVQDQLLVNGASAAVVGYGAYDQSGQHYDYDSLLREGFTTITDVDCSSSAGCSANVKPGGELGAGGDGVDACFGDSGGPLYLQTEYGDYLVGNTSRAYANSRQACGGGGIYSRPDPVIDWIQEVGGITIQKTTCNTPPSPSMKGTLDVPTGGKRTKRLEAGDPDQQDGFTWAVVEAPAHGTATVDDKGKLHYTETDPDYTGPDQVTVAVTDSVGYPPEISELVVPITVVKGCGGCSTPGTPDAGWLAAFIALLAVRRRRRAE